MPGIPGMSGMAGMLEGIGAAGLGGPEARRGWLGAGIASPRAAGTVEDEGNALADGAGFAPPMTMPGMLIAMFCMAAMRLVSESMRNCADVTTPSARPMHRCKKP